MSWRSSIILSRAIDPAEGPIWNCRIESVSTLGRIRAAVDRPGLAGQGDGLAEQGNQDIAPQLDRVRIDQLCCACIGRAAVGIIDPSVFPFALRLLRRREAPEQLQPT